VRCSLRRNPPILAHARNRTQQPREDRLKPIPLKAIFSFLFLSTPYVTLRYTNDPTRATVERFYMTTKTTLSDEEMAERGTHSCSPRATRSLCAFAAPSVRGRSNTVPSPDGEFLIANPELEFESNHRKQSLLRISNRKYFAIFSLGLPRVSPGTEAQASNPNSNIRTIKNPTNSRNITTYAFSNRNKIDLFVVCLPPRFSPRKGTSRDMIPALAPLK
jgi:hypothetical protein